MLVPLLLPYVFPGRVEKMSTPGAARSIAAPGEVTGLPVTTLLLKFVKSAKVSSAVPLLVFEPNPPGLPSVSPIAETVITSG
jgi:hypothetical protein